MHTHIISKAFKFFQFKINTCYFLSRNFQTKMDKRNKQISRSDYECESGSESWQQLSNYI